jgi:hypothetical protein
VLDIINGIEDKKEGDDLVVLYRELFQIQLEVFTKQIKRKPLFVMHGECWVLAMWTDFFDR